VSRPRRLTTKQEMDRVKAAILSERMSEELRLQLLRRLQSLERKQGQEKAQRRAKQSFFNSPWFKFL